MDKRIKIFKTGLHGNIINTDEISELIIAVPPDNIISKQGDILSIFGIGCTIFTLNNSGTEMVGSFVIATIFNTKPSAIRPSTHYPDHTDLVYDKDAYVSYVDQELTNSDGKIPIIKDSTNVELMYNKLNGGKFSSHVDYSSQMDVVQNNLKLNKRLANSPILFDELSIAYGFVDSKGDPYRKTLKGECYPASLLTLATIKDPFSALIHRDAKTSMMISLNNRKEKDPSLLEKYAFM